MKRLTQSMKALSPDRAPILAYPVSLTAFGFWAWRMVEHIQSGETESLKHMGFDAALLLIAFCAWPGFMRYIASNASFALDFYKRAKRAKEGDSTLPPTSGRGGKPSDGSGT